MSFVTEKSRKKTHQKFVNKYLRLDEYVRSLNNGMFLTVTYTDRLGYVLFELVWKVKHINIAFNLGEVSNAWTTISYLANSK